MRFMKTCLRCSLLMLTVLLGGSLAHGQNDPAPESSGPNPQRDLGRLAQLAGGTDAVAKPENGREKRPYLSPGIAEIVRMQEAGLDAPVIQAYIENSTILYRANADDLVYLHEHQIAPALITALIKRGAELRAQAAEKASQNQAVQAQAQASQAAAAPSYTTPVQPSAPVYVQSYPTEAYTSYPAYSYAPPVYYAYSSPYYSSCYRPYGYYGGYGYRSYPNSVFYAPRLGFSAHFAFG